MSGAPIRLANGKLRPQHGIHAIGSADVRWISDMNEPRVCLARRTLYPICRSSQYQRSQHHHRGLRRHLTPIVATNPRYPKMTIATCDAEFAHRLIINLITMVPPHHLYLVTMMTSHNKGSSSGLTMQ